MRQTTGTRKSPGEKIVKDIKRATRKQYSSEEKIRIILDGLRGEDSIAELCRCEGISQGVLPSQGMSAIGLSPGYRDWMKEDASSVGNELRVLANIPDHAIQVFDGVCRTVPTQSSRESLLPLVLNPPELQRHPP